MSRVSFRKIPMRTIFRATARVALIGLVGVMVPTASPTTAATSADTAVANGIVHIRKLHLVRPDLIPYPVYFEVVC